MENTKRNTIEELLTTQKNINQKPEKKYDIDRHKIYEIIMQIIKNYKIELHSETYGIHKINLDDIIDIKEILDLILNDERKGIRLLPYLDLSNEDFSNQDVTYIDFTDVNGHPNPQKVKSKDFSYTTLKGHDFKGCIWDGVRLCCTDFSGATNISFDPQKIMYPSLYGCICNGVHFEGELRGVGLKKADLRGATGVKIYENEIDPTTLFDENATIMQNEQEKKEQQLREAVLKRVLTQIPRCI